MSAAMSTAAAVAAAVASAAIAAAAVTVYTNDVACGSCCKAYQACLSCCRGGIMTVPVMVAVIIVRSSSSSMDNGRNVAACGSFCQAD